MKALKYIFAVLLILAVWGLWFFLDLPTWIAVVATVFIVLVLVAVVVWGIFKARRAASKIEAALAKQGAAHAAGARPDMQADINAMSSEFNKAVSALKSSELGTGSDALYALPWYMIIGPPGVGKSTALRNSGLNFPTGGGAVKGIGGTRNCDWWMSRQAVIVDTAGRYTTEDTDRDEWLAFLDLLKDTRPKRPINGILLAVSVVDLALANEQEINIMSTKIRARIDEVTKHLEMTVPIYVLFTKCDLLPGFVEMYSEMGKTERHQIWGFTLPVMGSNVGVDPIGTFCDQFDRLADRTEQRSFKRLGDERRIESRGKIYEFPQHFEMLRDNLASFIGLVFTANVYAETPMLRGCYFTSGTQEGRPIDRLMGSMAQAFGMQSNALLGQQQTEARSYFLGSLFNKVIFADCELGRRSTKHLRKSAIIKWAGSGAIFAAAVGLCVLPIRSMRANQEVLARVNGAVEGVETKRDGVATVERLYPLYEAQAELYDYENDSRPVKLRWGMYQGDDVQQPARDLFGRTVRQELILPLMDAQAAELRSFVSRYPGEQDEPPTDETAKMFNGLRTYLLLSDDYAHYRPDLAAEQLQAKSVGEDAKLADQVARRWAAALMVDSEGATFNKMKTVATAYVTVLREDPELRIERDDALVTEVQKILRRSDQIETWLAELIAAASEVDGVKDLTLASMKLGTSVYKNDGMRIRGAFTRFGWDKYARDYLAQSPGQFVGDEWVLGLSEAEARNRQIEDRVRLRSRYFDQYIKEWDQFVAKIYVDTASDLVGALTMFQELARGGTPLRVLLGYVAWHTTLEEAKRAAGEEVPWWEAGQYEPDPKRKRTGPDGETQINLTNRQVREHFEPFVKFGIDVEIAADPDAGPPPIAGALQIDTYQEQLTVIRDALQAAVDDTTELKGLDKKLSAATRLVKGQISEQQEPWRNRYDKILRPPFDATEIVLTGTGTSLLGASWCESVYQPYLEQIADKYPFNAKGYDLPIGDFAAWFAPDKGPVWDFYNASLAARIERNGSSFIVKDPGAAKKVAYNPKLPEFLTQFADIGMVMFPPGSDKPKFEFEVQIDGTPGVDEVILTVDGAKVSYRNGPQEWKLLVWPGAEGDPGASIKTRGTAGRNGEVVRNGDWGLWKLLAEATVSGAAGQKVYSVKWDLSDQQVGIVTVRLRPKRAETPLFGAPARGVTKYLGLFTSLKVPTSVVIGYACQVAGSADKEASE